MLLLRCATATCSLIPLHAITEMLNEIVLSLLIGRFGVLDDEVQLHGPTRLDQRGAVSKCLSLRRIRNTAYVTGACVRFSSFGAETKAGLRRAVARYH
jgi:hypothetical protein